MVTSSLKRLIVTLLELKRTICGKKGYLIITYRVKAVVYFVEDY
jgi:hypothetical protein